MLYKAFRGIERKDMYSLLVSAYDYCVRRSRHRGDEWDEASMTLMVHAAAMRGNPIAILIIENYKVKP